MTCESPKSRSVCFCPSNLILILNLHSFLSFSSHLFFTNLSCHAVLSALLLLGEFSRQMPPSCFLAHFWSLLCRHSGPLELIQTPLGFVFEFIFPVEPELSWAELSWDGPSNPSVLAFTLVLVLSLVMLLHHSLTVRFWVHLLYFIFFCMMFLCMWGFSPGAPSTSHTCQVNWQL